MKHKILQTSVERAISRLDRESVDLIVTSPPYRAMSICQMRRVYSFAGVWDGIKDLH